MLLCWSSTFCQVHDTGVEAPDGVALSSIPDEIFEQAERLAKDRGWSRSELYANAVSAFVNSERFSGVREKLDAVYGNGGEDSAVEPLLAGAQARSIANEKW
jgi:hypothetical protein